MSWLDDRNKIIIKHIHIIEQGPSHSIKLDPNIKPHQTLEFVNALVDWGLTLISGEKGRRSEDQ